MQKSSGLVTWTVASLLAAAAQAGAQMPSSALGEAVSPPQPLTDALQTWARQTGWQLMYEPALTAGHTAEGAPDGLKAMDALSRMLKGTGLGYRLLNERTVAILPNSVAANDIGVPAVMLASTDQSLGWRTLDAGPQAKPATSVNEGRGAAKEQSASATTDITEVIVTAQKRSERLQDVPVPVTAINADSLVTGNQVRLQDYYTRIPGLQVTPGGVRGVPVLTIRGVTTGGSTNPTVGITVDDVPYGSSTSLGGGGWVPDIDPSDLARVEVLRGPQGTLYGASSIGGLLKFVTVDPSTDRLSGRVQGGINGVYNGDQTGYSVRGAVNVPLGDTLAIRASGFTRQDPGYINDPVRGQDGVNKGEAYGGRVSALWHPADNLSIKLNALVQDSKTDGSSNVHLQPGLGDLEQSALIGSGGYHKQFEVYSASINAQLGRGADLTSISGYSINSFRDSIDYTPFYSTLTLSSFGVSGTPEVEHNETKKFSQEIRVTMPLGERLSWLVGAFYTREKSNYVQDILAVNENTGATVGQFYTGPFPTEYKEYSAFTDLTVGFTDQFDVQFGGRWSQNKQSYSSSASGPLVDIFYGVPSISTPEVDSKDDAVTYLVTPRLKLSPSLMLYARFASGYRPGGPNSNNTALGLPPTFGPDKTQNYELGIKGDLFERVLSYDASVYYIDWKDIQLSLTDPQGRGGYYANAGRAKSQGLELSFEAKPISGLTLGTWVAWNNAKLTEAFPVESSAFGESGDRLPDSAQFSGNFSLDQEFLLSSSVTGFAGASVSYIGERTGVFTQTALRQEYPAYARTDVRAGFKYESWALNLFVNNVTDKRAFVEGGVGSLLPYVVNYIQPRTEGLSLTKTF